MSSKIAAAQDGSASRLSREVERAESARSLVRPLRLAAVGDVGYGEVGAMVRQYGCRYPWLKVAPVLRRADIAVANLESAVSNRGYHLARQGVHVPRASKALRATAKFAGVDVVSLANNHSLDYGRVCAEPLRSIRDFGLTKIGGGRNLERARQPGVLEVGGLSVAFLGFSDVRPPGFAPGPAVPARPRLSRISSKPTCGGRRGATVLVVVASLRESSGTARKHAPAGSAAGAPSRSGRRARRTSAYLSSRGSGKGAPRGQARRLGRRQLRLYGHVGLDADDGDPERAAQPRPAHPRHLVAPRVHRQLPATAQVSFEPLLTRHEGELVVLEPLGPEHREGSPRPPPNLRSGAG